MNRDEIAALLAYAARLDPRTAPTSAAEADDRLDQWTDLLADVPPTGARDWDAARIVREHIASSPYPVLPADVSRAWHSHRKDAIGRHTDPTPTADPDDPQLWTKELRANRKAVATGAARPADHTAALGGRRLAAITAGVGQMPGYIHNGAREQLAAALPGRASREAARADGAVDPLTVMCTHCRAREGQACRRMGKKTRLHDRAIPHPSRVEAAHTAAAQQAAS